MHQSKRKGEHTFDDYVNSHYTSKNNCIWNFKMMQSQRVTLVKHVLLFSMN